MQKIMTQRLYLGTMTNGVGACISKVPFQPITKKEFEEAQKQGQERVIAFDGKYIKVLADYSIADFEFISYSVANLIAGRNTIEDSLERGKVIEINIEA